MTQSSNNDAPKLRVVGPDEYVISAEELERLKKPLVVLHAIEPTSDERKSVLSDEETSQTMSHRECLLSFQRQVEILRRNGAKDSQIAESVGGGFTVERMNDILRTAERPEREPPRRQRR